MFKKKTTKIFKEDDGPPQKRERPKQQADNPLRGNHLFDRNRLVDQAKKNKIKIEGYNEHTCNDHDPDKCILNKSKSVAVSQKKK